MLPSEPCRLDCKYGLKVDMEGRPRCECAEQSVVTKCDFLANQATQVTCNKKCEYGYKLDKDGCPKCKCNKCPVFNCTKRCVHGHIINDEGCTVCKCKGE